MFDLNAKLGSRRYLDVGRTNSFWDRELVVVQKAWCGLAIGSCAISGTEEPINPAECTEPDAGGRVLALKPVGVTKITIANRPDILTRSLG